MVGYMMKLLTGTSRAREFRFDLNDALKHVGKEAFDISAA